jgi:hypothetical protein
MRPEATRVCGLNTVWRRAADSDRYASFTAALLLLCCCFAAALLLLASASLLLRRAADSDRYAAGLYYRLLLEYSRALLTQRGDLLRTGMRQASITGFF